MQSGLRVDKIVGSGATRAAAAQYTRASVSLAPPDVADPTFIQMVDGSLRDALSLCVHIINSQNEQAERLLGYANPRPEEKDSPYQSGAFGTIYAQLAALKDALNAIADNQGHLGRIG